MLPALVVAPTVWRAFDVIVAVALPWRRCVVMVPISPGLETDAPIVLSGPDERLVLACLTALCRIFVKWDGVVRRWTTFAACLISVAW